MAKKEKKADAPSSFEVGPVRDAWLALEKCTTRVADQHVALSTSVRSKLVDPLAQFVKEKDAARKDAIHVGVASGKVRADALAEALKHATACDKLAVELHELEAAAQASASAKATQKRDAARERIAAARQKLAAAQHKAAQADQVYFSQDLPHALRSIELFESSRVQFLQQLLGEYVEIEDHLAHTITRQALPELSAVVDTLDSVGYVEALMRLISNTPNPNAPIPLTAIVGDAAAAAVPASGPAAPTPAAPTAAAPTATPTVDAPSPTILASLSLLSPAADAPPQPTVAPATGPTSPTPAATPSSEDAGEFAASSSSGSKYKNLLSMKAWRTTVRRAEPEKAPPAIVVTSDDRVVSARIVKPASDAVVVAAVPMASTPVSAPLPILSPPSDRSHTVDEVLRSPGSPELGEPRSPSRVKRVSSSRGGDDLAASASPSSSSLNYGSLKRGNWKEKMMAAMDRTKRSADGEDAAPESDVQSPAAAPPPPSSSTPSSPPTSLRMSPLVEEDELEDIPL